MAVVIADAGTLIALAKISQLHLLPTLFTSVLITQSVADKCLRELNSYTYLTQTF